jgi:glycosyltransferase involved in cell wall biosynthesis
VVFTLGTLKRRKGHRYLLKAMGQVIEARPEALCVIGGQGATARELERQRSALGLEEHVGILGFVPEEEVDLWMNACDAFCLPSLSEGNPTVMFEALGCGKPYLGTDVGGVSEVITSAEYGLLCEPADPEALAGVLLDGLAREWDRERIGAYAENFTWETVTAEIAALYADVLDEPPVENEPIAVPPAR